MSLNAYTQFRELVDGLTDTVSGMTMGTIAVILRVTGEADGPVGFARLPTDVMRHWSFQDAVVGAASITPDQVTEPFAYGVVRDGSRFGSPG